MLIRLIHGYGSPAGLRDQVINENNVIGATYIETNSIEMIDVYPSTLTLQCSGTVRIICRERSDRDSLLLLYAVCRGLHNENNT